MKFTSPKFIFKSLIIAVSFFKAFPVTAQVVASEIEHEKAKNTKANTLPSYQGGIAKLRQDIFANVPPLPCSNHKLLAYLSIDENGTVVAANLFRRGANLDYADEDIRKFLMQKSKWLPAMYKGNKTAVVNYLVAVEDTTFICPEKNEEAVVVPFEPIEIEVPEIFMVTEEAPEFPGGMTAMLKYIALESNRNISCNIDPTLSKTKIHTKFVVETDGSISNIEILLDPVKCVELEGLVKKKIAEMPKWKPGRQFGRAVRCYYNLPVPIVFN